MTLLKKKKKSIHFTLREIGECQSSERMIGKNTMSPSSPPLVGGEGNTPGCGNVLSLSLSLSRERVKEKLTPPTSRMKFVTSFLKVVLEIEPGVMT